MSTNVKPWLEHRLLELTRESMDIVNYRVLWLDALSNGIPIHALAMAVSELIRRGDLVEGEAQALAKFGPLLVTPKGRKRLRAARHKPMQPVRRARDLGLAFATTISLA